MRRLLLKLLRPLILQVLEEEDKTILAADLNIREDSFVIIVSQLLGGIVHIQEIHIGTIREFEELKDFLTKKYNVKHQIIDAPIGYYRR